MFGFIQTPAIAKNTYLPILFKSDLTLYYYNTIFYLPTSYSDNKDICNYLVSYIEDINYILEKNTNRRLLFTCGSNIIFTDTQPHNNHYGGILPDYNFEIWVHVTQSLIGYSYGGYSGLDSSGAGVLAGLHWEQIYDPNLVTGSNLKDYWHQINNMLHELAHVFRAGIGEYYKLASVIDTTEMLPLQNINLSDYPDDPYWSWHSDFIPDPLLRNAANSGLSSREELLNYVKFSELTAKIISSSYRGSDVPLPDLTNCIITVTHNGKPVNDAMVYVYSVVGVYPSNPSTLVTYGFTNSSGQFIFSWGGSQNPHNNYEFLRLIKVYDSINNIFAVKYWSIFDVDYSHLVSGNSQVSIDIIL